MKIDDLEILEDRLARAAEDARDLGDRYVPVSLALGPQTDERYWGVVDGWFQTIVERNHTFGNALNRAEELSRLNNVSLLEAR